LLGVACSSRSPGDSGKGAAKTLRIAQQLPPTSLDPAQAAGALYGWYVYVAEDLGFLKPVVDGMCIGRTSATRMRGMLSHRFARRGN